MAPASAIPPALPPSVEEAYRRKCIQLKQRTNEVEEANDASRVRLGRLKRQVEKMRLERAFLLEQLSKRTSTNVEDSDGSPSPPPTPKEKPLRIKRGHRKPSMLANLESTPSAAGAFISQNARSQSPSSDTFSAQHHQDGARLNGHHSKAPKKPENAFELWAGERRKTLKEKDEDGDVNMEEELARGWKDLDDSQREEFQAREDRDMAKYQEDKAAYDKKQEQDNEAAEAAAADRAAAAADRESQSDAGGGKADNNGTTEEEPAARRQQDDDQTPQAQEDVEMGNYDSDQETQGERPEE